MEGKFFMNHSAWEKINYEHFGREVDELFRLVQPTPALFYGTMPRSKRIVRLLSLDVLGSGRAPAARRLGLLAYPDELESCAGEFLRSRS